MRNSLVIFLNSNPNISLTEAEGGKIKKIRIELGKSMFSVARFMNSASLLSLQINVLYRAAVRILRENALM
jgi:hypothetical protein